MTARSRQVLAAALLVALLVLLASAAMRSLSFG
ncbi:MAG: hypothetical protein GHHEDOFH_01047 [Pseudorhodoplanes sp.]|nr:hypothetical protein [Pseudorhodoplanes sp.]